MADVIDKVYYGVADKLFFDRAKIIDGTLLNNSRLVHTEMEDQKELIDYVKQIHKNQAKLATNPRIGTSAFSGNYYIISYIKLDSNRIKILEKTEYVNKYLLLI